MAGPVITGQFSNVSFNPAPDAVPVRRFVSPAMFECWASRAVWQAGSPGNSDRKIILFKYPSGG